jgi:PAS domain S-box-containing protein
MFSKLTLSQKGIFLLSVTVIVQLSFVMVLVFVHTSAQGQIEKGLQTQLIIGDLNKVSNLWSRLGVEFPRILSVPDLNASPISGLIREIHSEFDALDALFGKGAYEKGDLDALRRDTDKGLALMTRAKDAWLENGDKKLFHQYLDQIVQLSVVCTARSNSLLSQFDEGQRKNLRTQEDLSYRLSSVLVVGLCVNIGISILIFYLFVARIARRVQLISNNSFRLANRLPLNSAMVGDDEIVRLDHAFHRMAVELAETARKEQAVVDNARDLICTLDCDGIFLTVNPAVHELLGFETDEMVGKLFLDFVLAEHRVRSNKMLHDFMDGKKKGQFESSMVDKAGNTVNVVMSVLWSQGEKIFYCVVHDITQHRQIEQMKRQFIAMITHDLRSPLNSIFNTLDSIYEGVYTIESERGKTRLVDCVNNVDRMLRLIGDLFEMGKFDVAALTLEFHKVKVSSIIQESIGSVRAYAEQQKLDLRIEQVEANIEADKLRIVQVLVNLLSNAIKFSPAKSFITVSSSCHSTFVRLEVTDNGRGISEADQKIIFEPYKQAQGQENKGLEGTGLGLTICKSIVEAHHGRIGVISAVPRGSTFWIELPFDQLNSNS